MPPLITIEHPKQLLVEGKDEVYLFKAIAKQLKINDIQVRDYGGYPKLKPFLKTFVALPGFQRVKSLAVVADANSSRNNREKSIRNALSEMNLPTPSSPLEAASKLSLNLVYLIVPHSGDTGMLEDVCLDSVTTDPAMQCLDSYFECILQAGLPGPNKQWMSKARIHAFLATRRRPDLRLGEAGPERYMAVRCRSLLSLEKATADVMTQQHMANKVFCVDHKLKEAKGDARLTVGRIVFELPLVL